MLALPLPDDLANPDVPFCKGLHDFNVVPSSLLAAVQAAGGEGTEWPEHVMQLIQNQQSGGSASAQGKGKGKKTGKKKGPSARGSGGDRAKASARATSTGRGLTEWTDSCLDSVTLSEEKGIAPDTVVRMRAIADASIRETSADVVEWRELHAFPMPPSRFDANLERSAATLGSAPILPNIAPAPPDGAVWMCHPSTDPWGAKGVASAALHAVVANKGALPSAAAHQWPPLRECARRMEEVVGQAVERHGKETKALTVRCNPFNLIENRRFAALAYLGWVRTCTPQEFVVELGGVCSVWETVAKEARGLGKQTIRPFPERWNTLLSEAAAADREAGRLKYDGHKRAAREAQGKRKADLGSVCTNPETNARTRSD